MGGQSVYDSDRSRSRVVLDGILRLGVSWPCSMALNGNELGTKSAYPYMCSGYILFWSRVGITVECPVQRNFLNLVIELGTGCLGKMNL